MKKKDKLPDFHGKCLLLNIKKQRYAIGLNDPHFEYQGGRLFIIGSIPEGATHSNWGVGEQRAVLWSRVTNYVIFEDHTAYSKALQKSAESPETIKLGPG